MGYDGFDGIELMMDLEDRLGVAIADRDAERLHNPGEVVEYLASRLAMSRPPDQVRCRSAAAFRDGRQRVACALGIPAATIRPATPVADLLPGVSDVAGRRATWSCLSQALGVSLPDLRHPARYRASAVVVGLVLFACIVRQATRYPPATGWGDAALVVTAVAVTFGVPFLLLRVTRWHLATRVPAGFETVGCVVSCLTLTTIPESPASSAGWTRHELWELVRDLTAKSAGCPPLRIQPDTRWGSL